MRRRSGQISRYTIFGERCSGTNFVRQLMYDNFGMPPSLLPADKNGVKHFFGNPANQAAMREALDCAVICIVRNPLDFFMSFWNVRHYQPVERLTDLTTFLASEFYSVEIEDQNLELMEDRHLVTGQRYRDIFEMRSVKCRFLHQTVPLLTPNSFFIRYEALKTDPAQILTQIEVRFGLRRLLEKFKIESKRILPELEPTRFDLSEAPLLENYPIPEEVKDLIQMRLDFETEELIGYPKQEILSRLRSVVHPESADGTGSEPDSLGSAILLRATILSATG